MLEKEERLVRREVRSPRSAAAAGILFSILFSASMLLIFTMNSTPTTEISSSWLESWSDRVSLVLVMVPFAGIAFLWFTGVIRDRVGDREDRFFATIFFGSGIILVLLWFMWAAIVGAMFAVHSVAAETLAGYDVYVFGFAFMNQIIGNFTLRMAGVFMMSIGTLWTKTGTMPRWLTLTTYVVALGFLFFAGTIREARFIFPTWVFVVSIYILILNYRRIHIPQGEEGGPEIEQADV